MIMGGALIVAVLVAMIVQAKLSPKGSAAGVKTTEILVASKKLMTGEKLRPEDVRWQAWPESGAYKGVIRKADQPDTKKLDVYEAPLRRNIEAGEPVTKQALIPDVKGGNNFLAALIAPGMRAVAIAVKANTMAGGFISPGDHVDVLLSYTPRVSSDDDVYAEGVVQRFASQTVLSNVRVLAVDQSAKDEGREAKVAKTVTLEVSPEGAEALALATRMGDITLSLRRIGDEAPVTSAATPLTTDSTTSEVIRTINDLKQKARTSGGSVRLYSGSSVQNVPVRTPALAAEAGKEGQ